jgi:hypothetical protein
LGWAPKGDFDSSERELKPVVSAALSVMGFGGVGLKVLGPTSRRALPSAAKARRSVCSPRNSRFRLPVALRLGWPLPSPPKVRAGDQSSSASLNSCVPLALRFRK